MAAPGWLFERPPPAPASCTTLPCPRRFDCTVEWPWPQTKITKKMLRTGSHKRNLSLMAPMPLTPLVPLITG